MSKTAARNWFAFATIFLIILFFRHAGSLAEIGIVALVAFFGGVFAQQWLKDVY